MLLSTWGLLWLPCCRGPFDPRMGRPGVCQATYSSGSSDMLSKARSGCFNPNRALSEVQPLFSGMETTVGAAWIDAFSLVPRKTLTNSRIPGGVAFAAATRE